MPPRRYKSPVVKKRSNWREQQQQKQHDDDAAGGRGSSPTVGADETMDDDDDPGMLSTERNGGRKANARRAQIAPDVESPAKRGGMKSGEKFAGSTLSRSDSVNSVGPSASDVGSAGDVSNSTDSDGAGGGGYGEDQFAQGDALSDQTGETRTTSTNSTAAVLAQQTIACGMNMTHFMILLMCVPIAFLVGYTAAPLDEAVKAESYFTDHLAIINDIMDVTFYLQDERLLASQFIAYPNGSAEATSYSQKMKEKRTHVDYDFHHILEKMIESDMHEQIVFLTTVEHLTTSLATFRERIDQRATDGPHIRDFFLMYIEEAYGLFLLFAKDPRAEQLENKILVLMMLRRIQNSVSNLRAIGHGFLLNDGHAIENLEDICAMMYALERDDQMIMAVGDEEATTAVKKRHADPDGVSFFQDVKKIMSNDPALYGSITDAHMHDEGARFLHRVQAEDKKVLEKITDGEIVHGHAVEEGMKLFGAVLACAIAAAVVIVLQRREQQKMEDALRGAHTLSKAVQRFVPKNQLKTMGIRSITQVVQGLQVEVAQTMLFSSIRDFTTLAQEMENTALFEWLQQYVARMSAVVSESKGYVDKFIGDALFCVFPQPVNGVRAGIQMHVTTDQLNLELVAEGERNLVSIGVGLHYGVVVAGVFGDKSRLSCTMVASDVNLASRLEALTKSFGAKIIASAAVIGQIDIDQFFTRCLGKVLVSGSKTPMMIYDVFQTDAYELKNFKEDTLKTFEKAVKLCDLDPVAASPHFERLSNIARARGLRDVACERRIEGAQLTPHGGNLSFEKSGEIKGSPSQSPLSGANSDSLGGHSGHGAVVGSPPRFVLPGAGDSEMLRDSDLPDDARRSPILLVSNNKAATAGARSGDRRRRPLGDSFISDDEERQQQHPQKHHDDVTPAPHTVQRPPPPPPSPLSNEAITNVNGADVHFVRTRSAKSGTGSVFSVRSGAGTGGTGGTGGGSHAHAYAHAHAEAGHYDDDSPLSPDAHEQTGDYE